MPVKRYKTLKEAEANAPPSLGSETSTRTAIALSQMDEATRRGIRVSQRGLDRWSEIWEGEADRERYALEQLRRADGR